MAELASVHRLILKSTDSHRGVKRGENEINTRKKQKNIIKIMR
jgi:hypothetical protein